MGAFAPYLLAKDPKKSKSAVASVAPGDNCLPSPSKPCTELKEDCRVEESVAVTQNYFNYNNVNCPSKNILQNYPFAGVIPSGPATGSWPCRNQESCNYFEKSNPKCFENS